MKAQYYSTTHAARLGGVSLRTLQRWIQEDRIKPPKRSGIGGIRTRLWSEADIDRIRAERRRGRPL